MINPYRNFLDFDDEVERDFRILMVMKFERGLHIPRIPIQIPKTYMIEMPEN